MKKNVKVILVKNVANLGQIGDVKEVSFGYARNFLMPNGLVIEATPSALAEWEKNKEKRAKEAEADLKGMEQLVHKLEGETIEIFAKASEEGTLYAAVSAAKIAAALKDKGFDVTKNQIALSHIKEIGEHEVLISLDHGLEARITLIINPEKK
ncbi:MAG: 50S ribosomal protein L9 [Candidatus Buchananbacteria bacterium]